MINVISNNYNNSNKLYNKNKILQSFLYEELNSYLELSSKFILKTNDNSIYINSNITNDRRKTIGVIVFIKLSAKINDCEKSKLDKNDYYEFESKYFNDFELYNCLEEIEFYHNQLNLIPIVTKNNKLIFSEISLGHPNILVYNEEILDISNGLPKIEISNHSYLSGSIDLIMFNTNNNKFILIERKTYFGDNITLELEDIFLSDLNIKQLILYAFYFLNLCITYNIAIDEDDIELYLTGIHLKKKTVKNWKINYDPMRYLAIWKQDKWNPIANKSGRIRLEERYCKNCFLYINRQNKILKSENTKRIYCSEKCLLELEYLNFKCHTNNCFNTFNNTFKLSNNFYCKFCFKNNIKKI